VSGDGHAVTIAHAAAHQLIDRVISSIQPPLVI
jgi:hypothetical protein